MSSSWRERPFHCSNDCRQTGCPGHVAKLLHHHTSDTVTLFIDGQEREVFDETEWRMFVIMEQEMCEGSRVEIAPPAPSGHEAGCQSQINGAYPHCTCLSNLAAPPAVEGLPALRSLRDEMRRLVKGTWVSDEQILEWADTLDQILSALGTPEAKQI